ncbi:MAG: hypothetical protein P1V36_07555 [Planctomycetota bacterium]|nr:hypothetical protein [Planctomycetota bacterium]
MTYDAQTETAWSPWRTLRILVLLTAATLLPATLLPPPLATSAEDQIEQQGELDYEAPPKPATPPDDPEAGQRILSRAQAAGGEHDWHGQYVRAPDGTLGPVGEATLRLACDKDYDRKQAIHDLKHGGDLVRPLTRGFDVGRHEILKHLYHRAMIVANADLEKQGLSLCQRVQAVNAGGTGDYTRDQDITVFAGDEVREKAFFDAVVKVARDELKLKADVGSTGGVDFPEIEVTFFPGGNDLPDARFATDVEDFALKYRDAIDKQAANPEAYKGGGADIEVKGRRVPGSMYVQQLTWENGKPVYIAETPQNFREGRSLFSGTAPERWQRFERAAHIFSDFVQGRQHAGGGDHDLTKGPLKYSGRAIEQFCELHGMKPWPKLKEKDRIALLRRIWPHIDPDTPRGGKIYRQIAEAIDLGVHVKTHKSLPKDSDPAKVTRQERMALRFLHNATAASVSQMARDMLHPPAFDTKTMRAMAGDAWDRMLPVERFAFARKRDATFRAATSRAAMENLLVAVSLLRNMDFEDGKLASRRPGARAIARLLDEASPAMRPVLELSSEYAEAWARKQQTCDPKIQAECDKKLATVRRKLVAHCPLAEGEMPSLDTLRKAAKDGPRAVLEAEMRAGRSWFTPEMREVKQAFQEHLKQAFPSHAEQWRNFSGHIAQHGLKDYVWNRFQDEMLQWDTLADLLTLIELYQNDAGGWAYAQFIGLNVGSRLHWAIGPLAQALMVYDKDPKVALKKFKELGKSVVFMTLCRVVPWAASVKIAFDVMRGTVVVTVGWAVGQANKDTIDALYTGEAGRTNMAAAGTVFGRMRDSGICVLPAAQVKRENKPKTGELVIRPDRSGIYRHFFRQWTGVDAGHVPRSSPPRGDAARFTMAHDMFVRVLVQQAEQYGPVWVPSPDKPFVPLRLTEKEVSNSLGALHPFLTQYAGTVVDRVLNQTAARSYRSYMEEEGVDVIREGLIRRFASDLLGGMIEYWQVRLTAQLLAARDIERTAVFQDWRVIADRLHKEMVPSKTRKPALEMRLEGGRWRPTKRAGGSYFQPPTAGSGLSFKLKARADGVPVLGGAALDGSEPVRVSAVLEGTGETGDAEQPVKIEVTTRKLKRIRKIGDENDDSTPLAPGDVVEDVVLVRALAANGAGPELARQEITLRVLLPESGETRKVPLLRKTEYTRDGRRKRRYVYFKRFRGMPRDWVDEYGEVAHGLREEWHGDGKTLGGTSEWVYGRLHGPYRDYGSKGDLIREVPFVHGVREGEEIRYDPDSPARMVITHRRDRIVSKFGTGTTGKPYVKITYRYTERPDNVPLMSGEARRWWPDGTLRWQGSYAEARLDLNKIGGANAKGIRGKVGTWEFFYENGTMQERSSYRDGQLDGPTETWSEEGKRAHVGRFAVHTGRSRQDGVWETYEPPGTLKSRVTWKAGETRSLREGPSEEFYEDGQPSARGQYAKDRRTGTWVEYFPEGHVAEEASYREGDYHGTRKTWFRRGDQESTAEYHKGELLGLKLTWDYAHGGEHYLRSRDTYDAEGFDHIGYYPDGAVRSRGRYSKHVDETGYVAWRAGGVVREFYANGQPSSETKYVDGEKHGPYRGFDPEGRETVVGGYDKGEKHGRWVSNTWYPGGGGISHSTVYEHGKKVGGG